MNEEGGSAQPRSSTPPVSAKLFGFPLSNKQWLSSRFSTGHTCCLSLPQFVALEASCPNPSTLPQRSSRALAGGDVPPLQGYLPQSCVKPAFSRTTRHCRLGFPLKTSAAWSVIRKGCRALPSTSPRSKHGLRLRSAAPLPAKHRRAPLLRARFPAHQQGASWARPWENFLLPLLLGIFS